MEKGSNMEARKIMVPVEIVSRQESGQVEIEIKGRHYIATTSVHVSQLLNEEFLEVSVFSANFIILPGIIIEGPMILEL